MKIEQQYPELFAQLDDKQRRAVVQSLAAGWHEGWQPTREGVRLMADAWFHCSGVTRSNSNWNGPDLDKHAPDPTSLVPIFHAISVEKPAPAADPLADVRAVISASYQRSPKEATRGAGQSGQQPPQARRSGPGYMSDRFPTGGLKK